MHGEEVINSIQTTADFEEESEEDGDAEQGTPTPSKSRTEQPKEDSRILRRSMRITEQRRREETTTL